MSFISFSPSGKNTAAQCIKIQSNLAFFLLLESSLIYELLEASEFDTNAGLKARSCIRSKWVHWFIKLRYLAAVFIPIKYLHEVCSSSFYSAESHQLQHVGCKCISEHKAVDWLTWRDWHGWGVWNMQLKCFIYSAPWKALCVFTVLHYTDMTNDCLCSLTLDDGV